MKKYPKAIFSKDKNGVVTVFFNMPNGDVVKDDTVIFKIPKAYRPKKSKNSNNNKSII
jgi:hypothetical protein